MDPGDPDEPSREELESRVEQLEQTVSKMLPDRRGVLKGLGAAAIGGAAVGGATGGASGQSATGQVGTASEPVDVEGAQGNFDSVNTDEATNTSRARDEWTTNSITINVPTDYSTLQEAVDAIPRIPYHEITIDVASGTDLSSEDVLMAQTHAGAGSVSGRGFEHKIEIVGDTSTPSNNPLGSFVVAGMQGGFVTLDGFQVQNNNPYDNENCPLGAYHSDAVKFSNIAYSGGTNGVVGYGRTHLELFDINFGSNVLSGDAIRCKHGAHIQEQRVASSVGTVGGHVYKPLSGVIQRVANNLSGEAGLVDTDTTGGVVISERNNAMPRFVDGPYLIDELELGSNNKPALGGPSSGSDPGLSLDGTWVTPDSSRPSILQLDLYVETEGSTAAKITVDVDESGGTTPDITYTIEAPAEAGSGAAFHENQQVYVPVGGAVRLSNQRDPTGSNVIATQRQYTL